MAGDAEGARLRLEESLAFWQSSEEPSGLSQVVSGLAVVAMYQSRYEDAYRLGEQGLELYRQAGQRRGMAMAIHHLATIEFALGRAEYGRPRFEEALIMFREVGDVSTETLCLSSLSTARLRCGDHAGAQRALRECLARLERFEQPREGVFALEALAELLASDGRAPEAARAIGAAEAARVVLKVSPTPAERVEMERLIARLRQSAGGSELEQAMALGRAMTISAA